MGEFLTEHAQEKSTFPVGVSFTDEDDNPVVPNKILWTLTTPAGVIVNSREQEEVTPDSSVDILMQGDDLALLSGDVNQGVRVLTIEGTYDSDLGSDLPLNGEIWFIIDSLVYID